MSTVDGGTNARTGLVTAEQIAEFRLHGMLSLDLRDIIGADRFADLQDAFMEAEAEGYCRHPGRAALPIIDLYRQVHRHYPRIAEYVLSPRLGQLAAELLGTDHVRLFSSESFTKRPGMGITPWHQDTSTAALDGQDCVTFWVAIDDLTPDMGTMRYVPGSHTHGLVMKTDLEKIAAGVIVDDLKKLLKPEHHDMADRVVQPAFRAGEVMAHHGFLVHGAGANVSNKTRRGVAVLMIAADARYDGKRHIETDTYNFEPGAVFDHPDFPIVY